MIMSKNMLEREGPQITLLYGASTQTHGHARTHTRTHTQGQIYDTSVFPQQQ